MEYDKAENGREDLMAEVKSLTGNLKTVVDELASHKEQLQEVREDRDLLSQSLNKVQQHHKVSITLSKVITFCCNFCERLAFGGLPITLIK